MAISMLHDISCSIIDAPGNFLLANLVRTLALGRLLNLDVDILIHLENGILNWLVLLALYRRIKDCAAPIKHIICLAKASAF